MNSILQFLDGKKTYLLSLAGVAFAVAVNEGWIHLTSDSVQLIYGLLGFGGLAALRAGVSKSGPADPAPKSADLAAGAKNILPLLALAAGISGLMLGCAALAPGADPLVVNVERTETLAKSTFDLVVHVDDSDRGFWRTNAPAFHNFVEWLRQPQTIEQTNTLPRAAALILSLDDVKLDYEASRASSNDLYTAFATLQGVVSQASSWLTITTNQPPHP